MNCNDKNICYYGKPDALPVKHLLRAGDLEVVYENGSLRYITTSGQELIRNIYSAVRDRNWGTVLPVITKESINQSEDEFLINYSARYTNAEIDFIADYQIKGEKNNSISFLMRGKALRSFKKNRIGFCVLHPLEGVKGQNCKITHPDKNNSQGLFPEMISPVSPVTNIVAMEWENDTANCRIDFEGDVWEMEDHRNWTDSSYKTYCTPLSIPFPAEISEGTEVVQNVIFSAVQKQKIGLNHESYKLKIEDKTFSLPSIGVSLNEKMLTSIESQILKSAGFKHLRHDLKFNMENWPEMLDIAVRNSVKMNVPLELALHFTERAKIDLELLQKYLQMQVINVKMIWIVNHSTRHTSNKLVSEVIDLIRKIFPNIPVGGGTDAYFAEFNRNRFDALQLDFVTYAVCPQVHAFDNDSLIENLAAQADTVESAKRFYPGKKVHISPITLKQRFNVVATGEEPPVPDNQLPSQVDERQMSLFAAGWTLGSLASLIKAGANAVTYYETVGWRGIIQGVEEPSKPALFEGRKGDIFPVYHLLRFIHKVNPKKVRLCRSNHPLKFTGFIIESETEAFLLLANHTIEEILIEIPGMNLQGFRELSAENMNEATRNEKILEIGEWEKIVEDRIKIKPYSVLFIQL